MDLISPAVLRNVGPQRIACCPEALAQLARPPQLMENHGCRVQGLIRLDPSDEGGIKLRRTWNMKTWVIDPKPKALALNPPPLLARWKWPVP